MTDRPILFSAPMIRALLIGRKTQTRRVLKNPEYFGCPTGDCPHDYQAECDAAMAALTSADIGYGVGDRLWVRERLERASSEAICYYADGAWLPNTPWEWKRDSLPSIHMPRRLSRLTLTIADVRVERLQDISDTDACAEGISKYPDGWHWERNLEPYVRFIGKTPRDAYANLWNSINGPGAWEANPWVCALTFTVEKRNIDQ